MLAPPPRKLRNYVISPCEAPLFSFWGALMFFLLEAIFSMWGGSPYVAKFLCLSPLCKNFYYAHALDAKVVASIAPWGNLREIARLARHPINLLIHFGAHFHIIFEKTNDTLYIDMVLIIAL